MSVIHLIDLKVDAYLSDPPEPEICRGPNCKKTIYFVALEGAYRPQPVIKNDNGEWTSHWVDCPNAELFRKK